MDLDQISEELRQLVHDSLPLPFRDFEWVCIGHGGTNSFVGNAEFDVKLKGDVMPPINEVVKQFEWSCTPGPIGQPNMVAGKWKGRDITISFYLEA